MKMKFGVRIVMNDGSFKEFDPVEDDGIQEENKKVVLQKKMAKIQEELNKIK